jgi:hypothetical protein
MKVFVIQKGSKIKKFIDDPSLAGKQQENEPGVTGYFHVQNSNGVSRVVIKKLLVPPNKTQKIKFTQ